MKKLLVIVAALVAVAAAISAPSTPQPRVPAQVITATGNHTELGIAVGKGAAAKIKIALSADLIVKTLKPFVTKNDDGKTLMSLLYNNSIQTWPGIVEELEGIAIGSGQSFADIFLLNSLYEVEQYLQYFEGGPQIVTARRKIPKVSHCTDVTARSAIDGEIAWGHNEDGDTTDRVTSYYTNLTLVQPDGTTITTFCFTYAGGICNDAFGFSSNGIVMSFNGIFGDQMNYNKPPVDLVARALFLQASAEDVVGILSRIATPDGKSANVGRTGQMRDLINVETNPLGSVGIHRTTDPFSLPPQVLKNAPVPPRFFYHVNVYETLNTQCWQEPSSIHRLARLNEFNPPNTSNDVALMLGDQQDALYPLYRNGTALDSMVTLTTAIFDLKNKKVNVWWWANPKSSAPTFSLDLY